VYKLSEQLKPNRNDINININKQMNINNNLFTDIILNRNEIPAKYIDTINVQGDGNCFFRCISMIYFGKEDYHIFLSTYLYNYILKNYETIFTSFIYNVYNGELLLDLRLMKSFGPLIKEYWKKYIIIQVNIIQIII